MNSRRADASVSETARANAATHSLGEWGFPVGSRDGLFFAAELVLVASLVQWHLTGGKFVAIFGGNDFDLPVLRYLAFVPGADEVIMQPP